MQYGERFVGDRALPNPGVGTERMEGLFESRIEKLSSAYRYIEGGKRVLSGRIILSFTVNKKW